MAEASHIKKGKPSGKGPTPGNQVTQLSIWEILEHPIFETNLSEEMELLRYAGKHTDELRARIEEQYRKDMATLDLASDNQMKELLKDFEKPEDLAVKYVEVITKKSRLAHHKRELIGAMFEPLVKRTAIDIINDKESKEKKETESCAGSSSRKDLS